MTEEQISIARRAVACKGWRWMPGMRAIIKAGCTFRIDESDFSPASVWYVKQRNLPILPDLTDPATLGCLLALVREAHASHDVFALRSMDRASWIVKYGRMLVEARTEAEALVAALEAAP